MGIKHFTVANAELAMESWESVFLGEDVCNRLVESEDLYVPFDDPVFIICYKWWADWLKVNLHGKFFGKIEVDGCRFYFSRASEAVRFKLTFGGA